MRITQESIYYDEEGRGYRLPKDTICILYKDIHDRYWRGNVYTFRRYCYAYYDDELHESTCDTLVEWHDEQLGETSVLKMKWTKWWKPFLQE